MFNQTAIMLVKLSVLLGFLVAVSLGQDPDCKKIPRVRESCCAYFLEIGKNIDEGDCLQRKPGVDHMQDECNLVTCVMKRKNYVLSDNTINIAALPKFVKQNLTDYAPDIETHLEKCYTDTKMSMCAPRDFVFCVMNVLMKECPSALWEKSEVCTVLKNYFNDCPNHAVFT